MFTGIITDTTDIMDQQQTSAGLKLTFKKPKTWSDLKLGESVATNGVCLTVADITNHKYSCELVPETLQKTTFGSSTPKRVNLERALAVGDRLGGHFVQGHVDGIGTVEKIDTSDGYRLHVSYGPENKNLVIPKGSITIDGVSLTITDLQDGSFSTALVPHTLEHTTLGLLKVGDKVNLEFDMMGK